MATINPVEGIDALGTVAALSHLVKLPGIENINVGDPGQLQSILGSIISQLDRLNGLFVISDTNFQTLYGNDGNINTGLATTDATVAAIDTTAITNLGSMTWNKSSYSSGTLTLRPDLYNFELIELNANLGAGAIAVTLPSIDVTAIRPYTVMFQSVTSGRSIAYNAFPSTVITNFYLTSYTIGGTSGVTTDYLVFSGWCSSAWLLLTIMADVNVTTRLTSVSDHVGTNI